MKLKQKTRQWAEIGWQGLRFPIPAEWHLGRVQGDRSKGYLRVDDDERARLEIRWEKPVKRPGDFGAVVDRMLHQLSKFSRKKRGGFTVSRGGRVASPPGKEFECFETKGEIVSYGCLMRCTTCRRTILGRVLGLPKEDLKPIARKVFESLVDHPGEDGLDRWDVYGLRFALPSRYVLQRTRLRTGALELLFSDRKTEIDVRRLGLAGIVLKDRTLKNFFINYCYKELRPYNYHASELEVNGHPGVGLTGPKSLRARALSNVVGKRYVHAYAWRCDDKVYIFRMTSPKAEDESFFHLAAGVQCHEEGQGRGSEGPNA